MNVLAAPERRDHVLILRDVRQQPQLDLAVVRVDQHVPRPGDEHLSYLPAEFPADGNILQIRLPGRKPPRVRDGHHEAGADAAVGVDDLQKPVGVGAFQFRQHPVVEDFVDDRVLVPQLFQHVGVGAPTGFRFLPGGQHQLFKQYRPELLRGVDVELLARLFPDALLQRVDGVHHARAEFGQRGFIYKESLVLHLRQHRAEGQFNVIKQFFHAEREQLVLHGVVQRGNGRGFGGQHGVFLRPALLLVAAVQQRHLAAAVRPVEAGKRLEAAVLHAQPPQVVSARRGVRQIAREGGIEAPPVVNGYTIVHHGPLQILDIVSGLGDAAGKHCPQRRAPVAGEPLPVQNPRLCLVAFLLLIQMKGEAAVLRRAPDAEHPPRVRDFVRRLYHVVIGQKLHRGAGALEHLRGPAVFDRFLYFPFFNEFREAELQKQVV